MSESDSFKEITAFGLQLEEDVQAMCNQHESVSESLDKMRSQVIAENAERPIKRSWLQRLFSRVKGNE